MGALMQGFASNLLNLCNPGPDSCFLAKFLTTNGRELIRRRSAELLKCLQFEKSYGGQATNDCPLFAFIRGWFLCLVASPPRYVSAICGFLYLREKPFAFAGPQHQTSGLTTI